MRVLIVEDDAMLADGLTATLRHEGFVVDSVASAEQAEAAIKVSEIDLIILDIGLPGMDGFTWLRRLRSRGDEQAVLVLTARDAVSDRVHGLKLGADDYLPKPFDFDELRARLRALARRGAETRTPALERAGIHLDPALRTVTRNGEPITLTPKEFAVLEILMRADGRVVSTEELLERAWDEHTDPFTNAVRVVVMTLRRRLGDPPVIETVVGSGYRL